MHANGCLQLDTYHVEHETIDGYLQKTQDTSVYELHGSLSFCDKHVNYYKLYIILLKYVHCK